MASAFGGGSFATLYLSPRDYHRIHMPCDGRLKAMLHIPGALFSVNPVSARAVLHRLPFLAASACRLRSFLT